jgi:hypothetical protein
MEIIEKVHWKVRRLDLAGWTEHSPRFELRVGFTLKLIQVFLNKQLLSLAFAGHNSLLELRQRSVC